MATSSSGSPNDGRGADLAIFTGIWTHSSCRLRLNACDNQTLHAGAGGGCGRSSAISCRISWHICRGMLKPTFCARRASPEEVDLVLSFIDTEPRFMP